jgi:hypothetical protein
VTHLQDKRGRPELERPDEIHPVWFDSRTQAYLIHYNLQAYVEDPLAQGIMPRQKADRTADENEAIRLVEEGLRLHQMTWFPSGKGDWLIYMPFLFVEPDNTWKLRNLTTRETYTVSHVGMDETRQEPTGYILLQTGLSAPSAGDAAFSGRWDRLEWVEPKGKLVEFYRSWPDRAAVELEETSGDEGAASGPLMVPTITALLARQEPGTIGKRPFEAAKQIKPRIRETKTDPVDPASYSVQIRGWWMDNIFRFDCYGRLNKEADKLVKWFFRFINLYTGVLKKNGVQEILYWQRRADQDVQRWRDDLPMRSVEYFFRTEELDAVRTRNVTGVSIYARVESQDPTGKLLNTGELALTGEFNNPFDRFHDDSGNYLVGSIDYQDSGPANTGT